MKKLVRVLAMIHEGSIGQKNIIILEREIKRTYYEHFGRQVNLVVIWMTIPYGQAFTAGKLSTTSTLQIPVADHLPSSERYRFMYAISRIWMDITGCNKNEFVLNAPDYSEADAQLTLFKHKFKKSAETRTLIKMFTSLLVGKVRHGYLTTTINN